LSSITSGMSVLVTGGAGYIGSHTCKLLAAQGYRPVTFDDFSTGHRWAVRYGPIVEGRLSDTALLCATLREIRPVGVVHFAASAYVGESMQDPQKYFRNNVGGTISLLDAMEETKVRRLVFSSTCATYGTPSVNPIPEHTPQEPVNAYGESKLFIERMLKWNARARGLEYVALRYFNAAGADPEGDLGEVHDPEPHLIPRAIATALGQQDYLEIFGTDYPTPDGTAIRDYTHVDDLARAHLCALGYLESGGTSASFNLGSGSGASVKEVVRCVESVSGKPVAVREHARRPGDPAVLVADPRQAATILKWRAQGSTLRAIVETAWRWHESRASGLSSSILPRS